MRGGWSQELYTKCGNHVCPVSAHCIAAVCGTLVVMMQQQPPRVLPGPSKVTILKRPTPPTSDTSSSGAVSSENNNTIKSSSGMMNAAVNDFKTKTVLKEAVDAVVSSFAKHSQGYGRGSLTKRKKKWNVPPPSAPLSLLECLLVYD